MAKGFVDPHGEAQIAGDELVENARFRGRAVASAGGIHRAVAVAEVERDAVADGINHADTGAPGELRGPEVGELAVQIVKEVLAAGPGATAAVHAHSVRHQEFPPDVHEPGPIVSCATRGGA